ncbi:hypothetical protein K443DRAFT_673695 [Laccaria amethystina LaAM-08-1]|uniref:Uncharacterized protein n=1 Tax=Laccaria amethystina LaAM-08-1 TaxID=1095629 RepID=A0A0C9YGH7_9AGAR|nr:hypothetical protein K443DRAFT_673695 [Laccaria amethystina LaAM-08-1]
MVTSTWLTVITQTGYIATKPRRTEESPTISPWNSVRLASGKVLTPKQSFGGSVNARTGWKLLKKYFLVVFCKPVLVVQRPCLC